MELLFYLVKYHGKVKVGVVIVTNALDLFCVALMDCCRSKYVLYFKYYYIMMSPPPTCTQTDT